MVVGAHGEVPDPCVAGGDVAAHLHEAPTDCTLLHNVVGDGGVASVCGGGPAQVSENRKYFKSQQISRLKTDSWMMLGFNTFESTFVQKFNFDLFWTKSGDLMSQDIFETT